MLFHTVEFISKVQLLVWGYNLTRVEKETAEPLVGTPLYGKEHRIEKKPLMETT